ncbi:PA4780 family RIO1-like protein kinase [Nitrosospira sp. NpAV]|uniref:PA4780 family RIO1-like protein kinase n=1 Tax=Nitrosospira sp. NpAV TaxID=58133 RepID=UPI0005A2E224|nr:PA4780 family RIO1-like protein kinase [Nitrosospira sp. NpAV]KIO50257.1 kinase [Nitrosospira sp. NpAV]
MKIPKRIEPLVEEGLVDEVICQLMSGKEAMVYVVRCGEAIRCAKVYKEANVRSFHQSIDYTEGRRVKSRRRARAIEKGTRYGRRAQENAWRSVELDSLCRLAAAGVRVPRPYNFFEGVLLMELVTGANGNAAPRLNDLVLTAEQACEYHLTLIKQVVRMLCVGIVHGDLSEYNVLASGDGLVIIDLPQAVDAVANSNAQSMLIRDIDNLTAYFGRFAPELLATDYGREIWPLYQSGKLHPDITLTGRIEHSKKPVNIAGVMRVVNIVLKKEAAWQRHKLEIRE